MYVCDYEMCIHISISVHVWEQSLLIPKPESFLAGGTLTEVYIVQIYLWTGVTYWILAPYQSTTLFSSGSAIYLCSTTTIFGTCVWVTVIHAGAMKFLSSNCMAVTDHRGLIHTKMPSNLQPKMQTFIVYIHPRSIVISFIIFIILITTITIISVIKS